MVWTQISLVEIGMNLPDILADISSHKVGTSSICMKDGRHFLLTQQLMISKNISEMFVRQQNNLDMEMMQF